VDYARVMAASVRLDRLLAGGIAVADLASIAERIAAKKAAYAAKADAWASRLDALDQAEPTAFANGDAAVAAVEADLGGIEKQLAAVSNLPPGPLAPSAPASPARLPPVDGFPPAGGSSQHIIKG
jgi:hypothetical protein